jgi:hypothetical protein
LLSENYLLYDRYDKYGILDRRWWSYDKYDNYIGTLLFGAITNPPFLDSEKDEDLSSISKDEDHPEKDPNNSEDNLKIDPEEKKDKI